MQHPAGRSLPLSLPRRLVGDLVHFARQMPTVPVQRRMNLSALRSARAAARSRPSWAVLFTKAYAIVCSRRPELRRAYLSFPLPRLFEYPHTYASLAVNRQFGDEEAVLFAQIRGAEHQSLGKLSRHLRRFQQSPVMQVGSFRRALRLSRWPLPVRRLAWWFALNCCGGRRARYLGTFGVSVYSALGAESLHPLSPLTTTLNYGVIRTNGLVDVRLVYDHRVLDGAAVARALQDLEDVLNREILAEVQQLQGVALG